MLTASAASGSARGYAARGPPSLDGGAGRSGWAPSAWPRGGRPPAASLRRVAEVLPRGGLDARGPVAEVDVVEVHLQDLVLGELVLDLVGDARFEELPAIVRCGRAARRGRRSARGRCIGSISARPPARTSLPIAPRTRRRSIAPCSRKRWSSTAMNASGTCLGRVASFTSSPSAGASRQGLSVAVEEDGGAARDVGAQPVHVGQPMKKQKCHAIPSRTSRAAKAMSTTRPRDEKPRQRVMRSV